MNTQQNIDDKARKIQEVINQLGWDTDINNIVERVRQLDNGLVQEDEFVYILNWSEKCSLIHKLDQFQVPSTPKKEFTIPDLYVVFNIKGEKKSYNIEIKTSKDNYLSWTETYYQGLINYSESTKVPILIAWKWRNFDIWTLFELRHFKKSISNYKIDFETAHVENLMSKLAGDYLVVAYDNFGFHIKLKKEGVAEIKENETVYNTIIESAYFTGKEGAETKDIDKGIFALLFSLSLDEKVEETDSHIIYSFTPSNSISAFAQSIPTKLARAFSNEEVNWLKSIRNKEYPIEYNALFESLKKGIDKELVRNILFTKPKTEFQ
jgi:Holliday junction resolvase